MVHFRKLCFIAIGFVAIMSYGKAATADLITNYDYNDLGGGDYESVLNKAPDDSSGVQHYGQRFRVDYDDPAGTYTLNSIAFRRGNRSPSRGGDIDTDLEQRNVFLVIFADDGTPGSFTPDTLDDNGYTFLGASTNTVNHLDAAFDALLEWMFVGITLSEDTNYLAIFSADAMPDNLGGLTMRHFRTGTGNGDAIFGTSTSPSNGDDFMTVNLTADTFVIPEPASAMMLGFASMSLLVRRKRQAD